MTLEEVFGSANHLTAAQECARAALVFVYGLALVRIAGRRVFGKWSASTSSCRSLPART